MSFVRVGPRSVRETVAFDHVRNLLDPVHVPVVRPGRHPDPELGQQPHRRDAVRIGDTDLLRREVTQADPHLAGVAIEATEPGRLSQDEVVRAEPSLRNTACGSGLQPEQHAVQVLGTEVAQVQERTTVCEVVVRDEFRDRRRTPPSSQSVDDRVVIGHEGADGGNGIHRAEVVEIQQFGHKRPHRAYVCACEPGLRSSGSHRRRLVSGREPQAASLRRGRSPLFGGPAGMN